MKYLMIILSISLLTSCEFLMKLNYGIKTPKYENNESIKKYLLRKGIDTTNVFVFRDPTSIKKAANMKYLTLPNIAFFNDKGEFVEYRKSVEECSAKANIFIKDIAAFSSRPSDPSKRMNFLEELIISTNNSKIKTSEINVFITWSIYLGKLNDEIAFEWVRLLENAKKDGVHLNYYLVNCDLQQNWVAASEN